MDRAYYSDWLYLPKDRFHLPSIKTALTFPVKEHHKTLLLTAYREDDKYIMVPREFFPEEKLTSLGMCLERQLPTEYEKVALEESIVLRDDIQKQAWEAMVRAGSGTLNLSCGKGKTVLALKYAASLNAPTVIVVNTTTLLHQWADEIKRFLGVYPGLIQGKMETWTWKRPIVVAMLHTLAENSDSIPTHIRHYYGLAVFDETHHISAEWFSQAAFLFVGKRMGLTATVERQDGTHPIFLSHIGPVFYSNLSQDLVPEVHFVTAKVSEPWERVVGKFVDRSGEFNLSIMWGHLAEDQAFIGDILKVIMSCAAEDRKILVLSRRLITLYKLNALLETLIPGKSGLVTGNEDPNVRPITLKSKQIILGITQLAQEGLDEPALDTLIMIEPCKGDNILQQAMGRIQRDVPKKKPKMFVIRAPYAPCYALCNTMKRYLRKKNMAFEEG